MGGPNHLGNLCDTTLLAVPHRALDAAGIPPIQSFEHTKNKFGKVIGDGRTREELNALGFPAKYLDVGVAVQPMYFYMGHISRYVRPGSLAVSGLVNMTDIGQPFRHKSKDMAVTGGGINDLARDGVEITVWPCEGSTRQHFQWNDIGQLQVLGHDWLGNPSSSCVTKSVDRSFRGLVLGTCNTTLNAAGIFEVVPYSDGNSSYVNFRMVNGKKEPELSCLAMQPLRNNGGAYGLRGGSQVTLGKCSSRAVSVCDTVCVMCECFVGALFIYLI
jgi:glucosylceramidase